MSLKILLDTWIGKNGSEFDSLAYAAIWLTRPVGSLLTNDKISMKLGRDVVNKKYTPFNSRGYRMIDHTHDPYAEYWLNGKKFVRIFLLPRTSYFVYGLFNAPGCGGGWSEEIRHVGFKFKFKRNRGEILKEFLENLIKSELNK